MDWGSILSAGISGAVYGAILGFGFSAIVELVIGKKLSPKVKNVIIMACVLLGYAVLKTVGASSSSISESVRFSPPGSRFSVRFPCQPSSSVDTIWEGSTHLISYSWKCEMEKSIYGVLVSKMPLVSQLKYSLRDKLIGGRDGLLAGVDGKLLQEDDIEIDGFPGKYLEVGIANGKGRLWTHIYIVEEESYQITVVSSDTRKEKHVEEFLSSFELLSNWVEIRASDSTYKCELPSEPSIVGLSAYTGFLGIKESTSYMCILEDMSSFLVTSAKIADSTMENFTREEILDTIIKTRILQLSGQTHELLDVEIVLWQGAVGRHISFDSEIFGLHIEGNFYICNNVLLKAMALSPMKRINKNTISRFLASFQILNECK